MTKDEELALDLALETLESIQAAYPCETVGKRIAAIKQARLAPVQEPVAIPEYIRDAAKHLHENRFEPSFMVRAIVGWINGSPPAAQPAPVQEPVAYEYGDDVFWHDSPDINDYIRANGKALVYATPPAQPAPALEGRDWSLLEATQESLREHIAEIKRLKAAQPAVPDAIIEAGESPDYRDGWND